MIRRVSHDDEYTYPVIAGDMDMSPGTLNEHLAHIFKKMDVHSRSGIVKLAVRLGLEG